MSDSGYNSVPMIVSSPGKYWTPEKIEEWKELGGAYDIRKKPHRYHKIWMILSLLRFCFKYIF